MKLLFAWFLVVSLSASHGFAQTAALTADSSNLVPTGGEITLQATVSDIGRPAALGWMITLPEGWTLVRVGGGSVPQVGPETGATGTLEFAYTTVPEFLAQFSISLRYPAGRGPEKIPSTAIVRKDGQLTKVTPAPVSFSRP